MKNKCIFALAVIPLAVTTKLLLDWIEHENKIYVKNKKKHAHLLKKADHVYQIAEEMEQHLLRTNEICDELERLHEERLLSLKTPSVGNNGVGFFHYDPSVYDRLTGGIRPRSDKHFSPENQELNEKISLIEGRVLQTLDNAKNLAIRSLSKSLQQQ